MSSQQAVATDFGPDNKLIPVRGGKFLSFFLSGEEYGIEILKVQEIMGLLPITRVPQAKRYLKGVINLRGKVIPVIDLRMKFGMPLVEGTNETCIVVVHVHTVEVGVIVDKVSEVIYLSDQNIEPAPSFGSGCSTEYILGIGKIQERVIILLNIDLVLPTSELFQSEDAAQGKLAV
jgi:purine-binding chemotaxis protein CheW